MERFQSSPQSVDRSTVERFLSGNTVPKDVPPPIFKTAAAIDSAADRMNEIAFRLETITQRLATFNQLVSTGPVPECDRKPERRVPVGALDRLSSAISRLDMASAVLCKEVENL